MKNKTPLTIVFLVLLLSAPAVYLLITFVHGVLKDLIPEVGSQDAWIGFCGSIIGGAMTILALYFTIEFERKRERIEKRKQWRPFVMCAPKIKNSFAGTINHMYDSCMYPITIEIENISGNLVKDFRIVTETVLDYNKKTGEFDLDNQTLLQDNKTAYGMWTVVLDDLVMIKPHSTLQLQTNLVIHPYSTTCKEESEHRFKVKLEYSYRDCLDLVEYLCALSYELVVNFNKNGGYQLLTRQIRNYVINTIVLN